MTEVVALKPLWMQNSWWNLKFLALSCALGFRASLPPFDGFSAAFGASLQPSNVVHSCQPDLPVPKVPCRKGGATDLIALQRGSVAYPSCPTRPPCSCRSCLNLVSAAIKSRPFVLSSRPAAQQSPAQPPGAPEYNRIQHQKCVFSALAF